jgi:hypothetical protein
MRYRRGIVVLFALSSLLLGRASSQGFGNTIPGTSLTEGDAVAILVGSAAAITVVTIVLVHNSHPTLRGCVTAGPNGMLIHNDGDQKTYSLTGLTSSVQAGEVVKVQGKKNKKQKDSAGDEAFMVTKINKDYGPCKAALATPPAASASSAAPSSSSGQ